MRTLTSPRNNRRLALVLMVGQVALLAAACSDEHAGLPCTPGLSDACYTGPAGTEGVGTCRGGVRLCYERQGGLVKRCEGQVLPAAEVCDGVDNNCDGKIDEGSACETTALDALKRELGIQVVAMPAKDRVGPAVVADIISRAMLTCQQGETPLCCARRFVHKAGGLFGLGSQGAGAATC